MSSTYFVSYYLNTKAGWAFGMGDATVTGGLDNMQAIKALADDIKAKTPDCTSVIILNWKEIDASEPTPKEDRKP